MPEHRRIEPRSLVGTGLLADPEAIEELQEVWARRERADRPRSPQKFSETLANVAQKEAEQTPKPPRKR